MASTKQVMSAVCYDKRGRILSIGKNSYTKTHPLMLHYAKRVGMENKTFIHAELDAILKCHDISKINKIKVFRFNKQGKTMLAKPCKVCQDMLDDLGIKNIEYTVQENN